MEKLRDIQRWAYVKMLAVLTYVDEAAAYWRQRFIDYVNEGDEYREVE